MEKVLIDPHIWLDTIRGSCACARAFRRLLDRFQAVHLVRDYGGGSDAGLDTVSTGGGVDNE